MTEELSKVYKPKITQEQANRLWSCGGYFHADAGEAEKPSYTIVIPPPNVTAPLHLGHALNNTLQDILIRFRRMQQFNTLWMPGTDHAGIATQTVVEKRLLSEQGKRRTDFEREEFVGYVQAWKDEYEAMIIRQLKAMGCSCDWDRVRFTMDEVCAGAVREAFFRLFKDGLIYRGKRLVNWDPATQTVLADDEVEHETVQGHFWYMQYPLAEAVEIEGEKIKYVTVATTRPETMLGDTAVAMNPADKRAEKLLGKKVRLPIVGRIIPIIADEHVVLPDADSADSEDEKAKYSTGFLKVTPAHDPDDWEIGQRHGLEIVNVMAPDGTISDKFGWADADSDEAQLLLGMDRFEAREAIVEWFRGERLLEDVREYTHEVGHSYRSHVPIEPYLSDQWYIAVKKPIEKLEEKFGEGLIEGTDVPVNSLASLALKPLLDGRLRFIPQRYASTYQAWLENLRDWPISRQLWWGHRIPIWHKRIMLTDKNWIDELLAILGWDHHIDEIKKAQPSEHFNIRIVRVADRVEINPLENSLIPIVKEAEGEYDIYVCFRDQYDKKSRSQAYVKTLEEGGYQCDEDVLDTWFSSALWPFSTLGWPENTAELARFYPGDVLCTAREIITLWVSRMVMMGQYCIGDIPFKDVYIHAMIQDGQGRKMSKSLGNGIDPLVAIDSHGADAMRFTLASMTTQTQDVRMPVEKMTLPDGREANTSPKFDVGRNFCNKLWNASRFVLMNLEGIDPERFEKNKMKITDEWILSRLARTIESTTSCLDEYRYSEPLGELYRFFWNDFCDWYLEWAKPRLADAEQRPIAQNVLAFVLDQILRLLHPFIPFISEGIFQKLNEVAPVRKLAGLVEAKESKALVAAQWPNSDFKEKIGFNSIPSISNVQRVVRSVRDIRNKHNIAPTRKLKVSVNVSVNKSFVDTLLDNLNVYKELICQLAGIDEFTAGVNIEKPKDAASAIDDEWQIYVHAVTDPEAERERLEKQKQQIEKAGSSVEAKLANDSFVTRAKPEVVARAREKLSELTEQLETIEKHLEELQE